MGSQIKKTLCNMEEEITHIENKDVKNLMCSAHEKKTIYVWGFIILEFIGTD
jgi:hypothetical protein